MTAKKTPYVSVIIPTYNRASTLGRAVDSVLTQDYPDFELLIVDDGSNDNTQEILAGYADKRIVRVKHETNRGVAAALNTGLEAMRGIWFTFLGSDDEMTSDALSTMLRVPQEIDPAIDAVTANCIDTTTGEFSGRGLDHDQWLDFETLVSRCSGEHWGLTKRVLLGDLRFNEKMHGGEGVVWYKISRYAKRYYIHKGLRLYHTEGEDRICQRFTQANIVRRLDYYTELAKETEYLDILRCYRPTDYATTIFNIVVTHVMEGRKMEAVEVFRQGASFWSLRRRMVLRTAVLLGVRPTRLLVRLLAKRK